MRVRRPASSQLLWAIVSGYSATTAVVDAYYMSLNAMHHRLHDTLILAASAMLCGIGALYAWREMKGAKR